jgi:hypothetical protein
VDQWVYDGADTPAAIYPAGDFVWSPSHLHFHFDDFARYELWREENYLHGTGEPLAGSKTTFCLSDTAPIGSSPAQPRYSQCTPAVQGIDVGWGDLYDAALPGQWIELGKRALPDGDYALRIIADPENRVYESPDNADGSKEGARANEGVRFFRVDQGAITYLPAT